MTVVAATATGLPALAALFGLLFGRRVRPILIAVPAAAGAAVLAIVVAASIGDDVRESAVRLTPTGALDLTLGLRVDGLAALSAVLVTVVALLVQVYSAAYLREDPRYSSYAALVSLFTAAMLLVVYTGDLIVLLVGWEVMGVCSYFLIGHHWETTAARSASIKAFVVTKLGDVPFLIGILVLATGADSFRIRDVLAAVPDGGAGWVTAGTLLLLGGVAGKSAQVPLQTWLPDAMAGPTPVSALIHAATMVAAGAYLVARLYPAFLASHATLVVLAVMAAVTMIGSALAALAQEDLKRVLAWSTVSQLAYMTGALAVGGRDAAMFHLLAHGAFKALLFLAAGVVIHVAGTGALAGMGGLRRRAPIAFWSMTAGLAALAGVPPFSGFFSKEAVLGAAEHTAAGHGGVSTAAGWLVLVAGLLTAVLTAAYATRVWLRVFFGADGSARAGAEVPAHADAADYGPVPHVGEAPAAMTWPLVVLAVPTVLFGFAAFTGLPSFGSALGYDELTPHPLTTVLALAAVLIGAGAVAALWRRDPAGDPARMLGPVRGPALRGFDVDGLYGVLVRAPVRLAAKASLFTDRAVLDTYVKGAAQSAWLLGGGVRRGQNGNARLYLTGLFAGVVVLAVAVAVSA
ncbi:NADH-quinone oxidoreductase subunit L [Streptomyces sp. SID3343]|uniref:NADH-quinone oxidoreductase subunit 5 family protein n=1 Tax=Streptomyces sp. SID3343 TaxID=2690260 RepID=UPI00136ED49B|nr:NADH-quinone oxidoreductase subunit L [Streptomyces sp. SID3343]MYW02384.1 NADH-quinone oxidoreductase subunit L [Streptomyces sp. SID3343]